MFGKSIKLFNLFGFVVRIDFSWFIIGLLVMWSLASGVFPTWYPDLSNKTYWLMGAAGAIGLFFSIIWHEFCHSIIARKFGLPIGGITLFIFGGVAEMNEEPKTPAAEFFMALAGPLSSFFLGAVLLGISLSAPRFQNAEAFFGAITYMGVINIALAIFNMLPGFPLDGGRLLRAALWYWKGSMRWATRVASKIGGGVGLLFIIIGVINIIRGPDYFIGGIWYCLIGLFLRNAAASSYQQLLMRQALGGEKVFRFMTAKPIVVSPDLMLNDFIEKYVYRYHHKFFPVLGLNHRLVGYITTRRLKEIPVSEWENRTVGEVMLESSSNVTISPYADAMSALSRMNNSRNSRLMVVENQILQGIITLKDLLEFFNLKLELEEEEGSIAK